MITVAFERECFIDFSAKTCNSSSNQLTSSDLYSYQMTENPIQVDHMNLEYLSGVNTAEGAQNLLDISNNTNNMPNHHHQQQQHPHPHQQHPQHQSLAAQHIQQFKMEYSQDDGTYGEEPEDAAVSHCAVEVDAVPANEENNSVNSFNGSKITSTSAATGHPTQMKPETSGQPKNVYQSPMGNGLVKPNQPYVPAKKQRIDGAPGADPDLNDALTAAVDYFKHQTAVADADAAFAKYILEELREMSKKRKNEFKRKVTAWLTSDETESGD